MNKVLWACCLSLGVGGVAVGQSIYVDLDINDGTPEIGFGAPSASFGGATGVPGFWNLVPTGGDVLWSLRDTNGSSIPNTLIWTGSGGDIGFNNPINTGDYALLLNDAEAVGAGGLKFTFSGMLPGSYRVFTYAVKPQGEAWTTQVSVVGSDTTNPQVVTGPMPGNQLIEGITHSVHHVSITGTSIEIQVAEHQNSYVNGIQILAVPEPSGMLASVFGFAWLGTNLKRRR